MTPNFKLLSVRFQRTSLLVTLCVFLHACGTLQDEPVADVEIGESSVPMSATARRAVTRAAIPIPEEVQPVVIEDVWERIRQGFVFINDYENEKILTEQAFYAGNQTYLNEISQRAAPFLFDIVEEIERRQLPMELALLPVIESAFNPTARSPVNAVGLWQFMSATGRSLGLKQDWWYDGRQDPHTSTVAALDYLESLYAMFDNDWLLALAAYNAGQGNVQRAIQRNLSRGLPADFWSLPLPRETLAHVPRLIGLSRLVADPERHNIELPPIANTPAVARIDIGRQIDLAMAAQLAGLEPEVIYQLNPGYRQWATHPDGPHELLLPVSHAEQFNEALQNLPADRAVTWDRYIVKSGDTLGAIASQFRTQVSVLQQVNSLKDSRIIAGESLLIPRAYNSTTPISAPNAPVYLSEITQPSATLDTDTYTVRRGDSLWLIANRHNLTVGNLRAWNNLSADQTLYPGQQLNLRGRTESGDPAQAALLTQAVQHRIQSGDTLWEIARRYNVSLSDLTSWNNIRSNSVLRPGQELVIHLPQVN